MKIFKKGNYIYLVNASGDIKQDHANEVKITKSNVNNETYSIYSDDLGVNYVPFSEITQENGTAYANISAWELWYAQNTGFNPASGGSGAGTVINTVSNFASLPDPTIVTSAFYWVSIATGFRIIGTYKANGLYYSNGVSWEYIDAPTTATQNEVNTGTLTDKYLTPSTFENASKWVNYLDKATYDIDNDGIVDKAKKEVVEVINKTGATLTKGTIVYIKSTSSSANFPEVLKANATNDEMSSKTIGAIFEDILADATGLVVTSGEVNNLNTSAYSNGTKLWLSVTDGQVTSTIPIQPYHNVFIGTVTRSQTVNGRILYSIQNGYELDELHNVLISNVQNNDLIQYNSSTSLWENKQPITYASAIETYRGININNNSTTLVAEGGVVMSTTGSLLAQSVASTNLATKQTRVRVYTTTVSGGRLQGTRGSAQLFFIHGGFRYVCDFNISDTGFSSSCQQFYGLGGQTGDLVFGGVGGVLVSTLANIIGVGSENGDTNLQIFHNDATGTATKINLGVNFPANRTVGAIQTTVYSIELFNAPNSNNVSYSVKNAENGADAKGIITTNLPLTSLGLNFFASRTMGNPSITGSGQFDLMKLGVYSQL